MSGAIRIGFVAAVFVLLPSALTRSAPAPQTVDDDNSLAEKLGKPISLNDPIDAALDLALTELADEHGLQGKIIVDKEAFKAEGIDDVAGAMVKLPKVNGMKLGAVLEKLVQQVGGACIVRGDHLEITTLAARWKETNLGGDDPETNHRKTMPLVRTTFKETPLRKALEDLGAQYDRTIILAPQTAEKGDTAVSARLVNVPLDSAVEMLADMAELTLVRKANALYVTTPERAEPLMAAEEKRKRAAREYERIQLKRLEIEAKKQ